MTLGRGCQYASGEYRAVLAAHGVRDRGAQYASAAYQALLTAHGAVPSMSAKGDCYDTQCTMRSEPGRPT